MQREGNKYFASNFFLRLTLLLFEGGGCRYKMFHEFYELEIKTLGLSAPFPFLSVFNRKTLF